MISASIGTRAVFAVCGLLLAAAGVTAEHSLQGLEFIPRFTRLLRQDLGIVPSYLLPTETPSLCAKQCCQADSYASPYGLFSISNTQHVYGGRTYTTFYFVLHSNHTCNSMLDKASCCTASADTVWVDVDPTLKVTYVLYNGTRLASAAQSQYGLKLGSLHLTVAQLKSGIPLAITVEGAADALCPPSALVPLAGLCELIVQGGTAANPSACCPNTVAVSQSVSGPDPPIFQCSASSSNNRFKLVFDDVTPISSQFTSTSMAQAAFLSYNFRLVGTSDCTEGIIKCCNAQLAYVNLKVTDLPISGVQLGGISFNYSTSSWNEPNSASYRSLIVDEVNLMAEDLGSTGLPFTVMVRVPAGASASSVDLCDASSDPQQGACSYYLHSEDGLCCPSGLALPSAGVPPPPSGTCAPTQNVPVADTSMSLQYYERTTSAATTTFAFLLANHNPASGCSKIYCVDVCSWTLYLDPSIASQVAVGHENPQNNDRQTIEAGSATSPASLTFNYGPIGESTATFYVTVPAGGKSLSDLCARNSLPGQGARPCAAIVRSMSVYIMVFFDDSDVIIVPGAMPPPPPLEQMCTAPRAMSDSCLVAQSARYNTMSSSAVFDFPVAPVAAGAICQPPVAPGDLATVHLLLSPATVDQLTTRKQVRPSTGLLLDRNYGARWQVSATSAASLSFQVQGPLGIAEVCKQGVSPDQPVSTCVVEVSGDLGCFRGYVTATADGRLIWVEESTSKKGVGAGIIVPAIVVPLVVVLLATLVVMAWYRRRKGQQYFFMNSGSDDLDRPLATQSINSLRDDMVTPTASTTDVQIRVPGASHGGAAPIGRR
ncbi:hypothetical protein Vretimale_11375 [Volvox reticuliferus]|uniref:Pherophorin domain-containing protein n=1 Tax=Volvox reticuliferus TaxID=1737510 RepID=A0A8J4GGC4_9CHLO|nr:hypothetical protein Vretifemale_12100 [Volvox reticuliferus]GIM07163.1 hypothetical protein Vretimale_11375 [Volvox reticuliferus]